MPVQPAKGQGTDGRQFSASGLGLRAQRAAQWVTKGAYRESILGDLRTLCTTSQCSPPCAAG